MIPGTWRAVYVPFHLILGVRLGRCLGTYGASVNTQARGPEIGYSVPTLKPNVATSICEPNPGLWGSRARQIPGTHQPASRPM